MIRNILTTAALLLISTTAFAARTSPFPACFERVPHDDAAHPRKAPERIAYNRWQLGRCDQDGVVRFNALLHAEKRQWRRAEFSYQNDSPITAIDYAPKAWDTLYIELRRQNGVHVFLVHPVKGSKTMSVLEADFNVQHDYNVEYFQRGDKIRLNGETEAVNVTIDPTGRLIRTP